ncbi:MAG: NAD-dependent epimerase/dehydratase family protein [Pleurocapsa sp. MO_226.B13]|nr:NAD-dependent epimerase/dehydratase family protein [Pleurocapsa sp. MO_226.B13]
MSNKILISGGAGFVGSSLAIGLKQLHPDWKIVCLDNLRRRGSELNLPRFKALGIEFTHGDVRFTDDLDPQVLDVDLIVDCSAEPSVLAGVSSPQYVLNTNLVGTINILELARKTQAGLLFLSTSRVYSIAPLSNLNIIETSTRLELASEQTIPGVSYQGITEDFPLDSYRSLYGTTKLASELLIAEYRQSYGLQAIVNRCGILTGPWQMGKVDQGVVVLWLAAHYFRKSLKYIGYGGTGKQVRDFLHVRDLLRLVDYQLNNFDSLDGDVLNVGGGRYSNLSLLEMTHLCQEITGNTIEIEPVTTERTGDIPIYITDCDRLQQKIQWQPKIKPQETFADIYNWIVAHEDSLRPILA